MKKTIAGIIVGVLILQMLSLFFAPISGEKIENKLDKNIGNFIPNEIIVKFKNGVRENDIRSINSANGLSIISKSLFSGFHRLKIPNSKTVFEMAEKLSKNPLVEYAEPNYIAKIAMTPNDPLFDYQWHMLGVDDGGIDMESAWDIATGSGAVVAIIDTGISTSGNDLVDTCFVDGYDFVNDDDDPTDDHGHGTHVAGTVAQSTNNGVGVCGVAFDACLMPIKVLDEYGYGTYADIIDGIDFAVDNGANIISMSLGGSSPSSGLENALSNAYSSGVTCVAASGNSGQNGVAYPAAYDDYVIAVGATRYDKTRSYYSNYGDSLDVVAPGGDVTVDQNGDGYADGVYQETFDPTWGYYFWQGTSMATPHVSGVAALLYSDGVKAPDDIRNALESTAVDLGSTGWDIYYGYGLINAYDALQYSPGNSAPTCTLTADPNSGEAPLITTFSMTASDNDGNISSWELDVDNDGTAEYSGSGSPPATQQHTYNTPDTYTAELTVWDDEDAIGIDTAIVTVTAPNNAPNVPINPDPADGAIDVSLNPTLSVYVYDADDDTMDVTFYDEFGVIIDTDYGVTSGSYASVVWSGLDYSTTYGWYTIADDNKGGTTQSSTWYFTTIDQPTSQDFYTTQDIEVQNGGISGSYIDTHSQNDMYEGITEAKTGPRTKMEHKWTIDITRSYNKFVFNIDAYHTVNSDEDDFVFAYSTDNALFTDMITVTKTSDNDVYQTYSLPSSLSGTVYIRVIDTDQTKGNTAKDTIYIDHLYIAASNEPNQPPAIPTNPNPADDATEVEINPPLSVTVSDPNGDNMDVTFYDASDYSIIDVDYDVPSGETASVVWPNLEYNTSYSWYAVADDGEYTTQSDTWAFTTGNQAPPGGMYVWDISWVSNRHLKSIVTIRRDSDGDGVAEASDALVTGATVYFTLTHQPTGDFNDYIDSTGDTGTVTFTWKHAPSGNYEGIVTDITHSTYSFTSAMDADNPDYFTK